MSRADVFKDVFLKLVESLPIKDSCFIARLVKAGLFSGDLQAKVGAQTTRADGATVFLNEAIKPYLDLEKDDNPLFKLLSVMNEFDNPQLKRVAADIMKKLSPENSRRRTSKLCMYVRTRVNNLYIEESILLSNASVETRSVKL